MHHREHGRRGDLHSVVLVMAAPTVAKKRFHVSDGRRTAVWLVRGARHAARQHARHFRLEQGHKVRVVTSSGKTSTYEVE